MWEKTCIDVTIAFPVNTMQFGIVEFLFDLSPSVVEQILAFLIATLVGWCIKLDSLFLVFRKVEFLDAS